ncbi:MAG: flagellar basal body-associated FliL family protein [Acetatifactor sp.]|nr:flagellar basal body-associated FliL family protein [Acetatifactor sp.]
MKRNLLTILILALLIVNIVLTVVMMVSVTGTNKKTGELVSNIATVMNLEISDDSTETENAVSLADTTVYTFSDQFMILLSADENGKQGYILFDLSLSENKNHEDFESLSAIIDANSPAIRSAVENVVSKHTEAECKADFDSIRQEILSTVQETVGSDFIYSVSISNVKYG